MAKISLVKSAVQIARYGGIEFRRASDVNIVTGFLLPLCFYFLMLGHQEVLAAPARVEGRVKCYKSVGKNECYFTIWLTGEIDSSTVNDVKQVLDRRQVWVAAEKEEIGLGPGLGHEFYIDSPGGNLAAAIAIGRMIRMEKDMNALAHASWYLLAPPTGVSMEELEFIGRFLSYQSARSP